MDTPTPRTNRELLKKGITRMAITLFLILTGPIVIHSSFKNQDKPLFYPVLIVGITFCVLGVLQAVKGLQIILKALFNDTK